MWSNIIFYMKQYTPVSEKTAANYIIYSLVAMLVGRFVSTPLMKFISPSRLLGIYGAANVVLMAVAVTHPGMLGAWAIVGGSFFLSIMFPTIFALGLKGLGENTKLGGSMLVMAIVGGAFFPLVLGVISRATGSMALGYLVPLLCFAGVGCMGLLPRGFCRRRVIGIRGRDYCCVLPFWESSVIPRLPPRSLSKESAARRWPSTWLVLRVPNNDNCNVDRSASSLLFSPLVGIGNRPRLN